MKYVLTITLMMVLLVQWGSVAGQLRDLYNSRVVRAERWERPLLSGSSGSGGGIARALGLKHSGVVVTLVDGRRYLVHKGNEYGEASETVVADAGIMSSAWTMTESKAVSRSTVGDYVTAGGRVYSLVFNNCHHASHRMMRLP